MFARRSLLLLLLVASPVSAQVRPGNFSTLNTTDTSADSLHVGCVVASSTCTGGIKSGPIVSGSGGVTATRTEDAGSLAIANTNATLTATVAQVNTTRAANVAFGLLDLQANSVSQFKVGGAGAITGTGSITLTTSAVVTHGFVTAATGFNILKVSNTTAGTGNAAAFKAFADEATGLSLVQTSSTYNTAASAADDPANIASATNLVGARGGGVNILAANGPLRLYSGSASAVRWGVNTAGDLTFGASLNITESSGTPTCSLGTCTGAGSAIVGTDYAFEVTGATAAGTGFTMNFGHTWSNKPVCVAQSSAENSVPVGVTTISTTQVGVGYTNSSATVIRVLCKGY